jgi:hypothetical protein
VDTTYSLDGVLDVGGLVAGKSPLGLASVMTESICSKRCLEFHKVAPVFHALLGQYGVGLRFEVHSVGFIKGRWRVLNGDFYGVQSCGPARSAAVHVIRIAYLCKLRKGKAKPGFDGDGHYVFLGDIVPPNTPMKKSPGGQYHGGLFVEGKCRDIVDGGMFVHRMLVSKTLPQSTIELQNGVVPIFQKFASSVNELLGDYGYGQPKGNNCLPLAMSIGVLHSNQADTDCDTDWLAAALAPFAVSREGVSLREAEQLDGCVPPHVQIPKIPTKPQPLWTKPSASTIKPAKIKQANIDPAKTTAAGSPAPDARDQAIQAPTAWDQAIRIQEQGAVPADQCSRRPLQTLNTPKITDHPVCLGMWRVKLTETEARLQTHRCVSCCWCV